ncbi:MAG: hypothetical protein MZV65_22060 [Chromatiales bacterium]|nr:hypothetical protein [Chromatiales bacterium]
MKDSVQNPPAAVAAARQGGRDAPGRWRGSVSRQAAACSPSRRRASPCRMAESMPAPGRCRAVARGRLRKRALALLQTLDEVVAHPTGLPIHQRAYLLPVRGAALQGSPRSLGSDSQNAAVSWANMGGSDVKPQ